MRCASGGDKIHSTELHSSFIVVTPFHFCNQ
nr:MAG TPA: hypothetical protein [Caudoviricetes sp.]